MPIAFLLFLLVSCNPKSEPIHYGEDKCEFCRMSIVDRRFAGEIVTKKGKIFKFDATECMVNYLDERVEDEANLQFILTNTYDTPGTLVDASTCIYLKSKNMPSPMGMFLNPFKDASEAIKNKDENSGTIMNWQELREEFAKY